MRARGHALRHFLMEATPQVMHVVSHTAGTAHTRSACSRSTLVSLGAVGALRPALALQGRTCSLMRLLAVLYAVSAVCAALHAAPHGAGSRVGSCELVTLLSAEDCAGDLSHLSASAAAELLCKRSALARAGGRSSLLHELNARVYVAELPPKYNLHTIAKDGCKESNVLATLLGSPLGTLLSVSLDDALYRCRAQQVSADIF